MTKYLPALLLLAFSTAAMAAEGGNIVISGKVVDASCSFSVEAPAHKAAEAISVNACADHIKAHMKVHLLSNAPQKEALALHDGGRIDPADAKVVFAVYL